MPLIVKIKSFMAAYANLADNEMNYYQFKAKQILLQKKEEKEWQDFCKQIAPDCAACVAEKTDLKESKDIGVQTFPKRPISRTDKTFSRTKYQKEEMPEALINIKTRLEKIDLALTKLFEENEKVSQKNVFLENKPIIQGRNHMTFASAFPSQQTVKLFEEQRKLQIQNGFKVSLQNSSSIVPKKSPAIKPRNSSFFIPHDLEVKRTAARKAYLASLQTVPKVSFQTKRQGCNEKVKNSQSKKSVSPRKKIFSKRRNQKSKEDKEETLIEDFVSDDTKDENIEGVVDAIFEDLLGEATLDLNRIREKKREKYCNTQSEILSKEKKPFVLCNPTTSSLIKCEDSKYLANNNTSIMKLKHFIDSSEAVHARNNLRKEQIELVDKSTSTFNIEDSKAVHDKRTTVTLSFQRKHIPKIAPKFVCGVTDIIKIDPEKAKDVISKRDRFWRYLESISQTAKGKFNPWLLNESLAESILNDCINDIARELSDLPSSFVQDLYNQEFKQQVEI